MYLPIFINKYINGVPSGVVLRAMSLSSGSNPGRYLPAKKISWFRPASTIFHRLISVLLGYSMGCKQRKVRGNKNPNFKLGEYCNTEGRGLKQKEAIMIMCGKVCIPTT